MAQLRLEQRPELRQILTPKLIETLKLLILPKIELESKLQQELMENPMLEEKQQPPKEQTKQDAEIRQWKKLLDGLKISSTQLPRVEDDGEPDPLLFTKYQKTMYEDLTEQLAAASRDERTKKIGEFIIGNLDDRGFLNISIEQIRDSLISSGVLSPPPTLEEIEKALRVVQTLSPPGIAARNLQECFLLQLEDLDLKDSLAYYIVQHHFDDLKRKNIPQLAEHLGVSEDEVENAFEVLAHLSMFPAEGRGLTADIVEPDLAVFKDENGEWQVVYNDGNIPELSINKHYYSLLRSAKNLNEDAKKFLLQKLESAKWWIDALQQRKHTLISTMKAILNHQRDFFEIGPQNINPLKMETIADEIGVHPATISRVVRDKYVLTPFGTFPLRKFFTGGLSSDDGQEIATDRVKQRIREIIENEDTKKPYPDDKIAKILQSEGIKIARRTVAKYREQMGILPARMRKR
ncbi:RNA polymerase factor sigma-54 [bacterium]|nr:RNA polymerase factor sigma-54 [bacterium]